MQLLNFACRWFGLLFINCAMMFTALKCENMFPFGFFFKVKVPMSLRVQLFKNHKYLNYASNNMLANDDFVWFSNFHSKFLNF